jgi:RNA polymerase-binding transcription factor DksA
MSAFNQITNEQIATLISQNQKLISLLQQNVSNDSSSEVSFESILNDTSDESYVESDIETISESTSEGETISELDSDSYSLCEESGKPIPQKTVRKLMKFAVGGKSSYTPQEVYQMDDFTLTREFMRITGYDKLNCKHCKHPTSLENWIVSIRKRCLKKDGLSVKTKIPKTCDQQQAVNTMRNPVNNKVYPIMRASTLYWEDYTTKAAAMNRKAILFNEIGLQIKPYKYKVFN